MRLAVMTLSMALFLSLMSTAKAAEGSKKKNNHLDSLRTRLAGFSGQMNK